MTKLILVRHGQTDWNKEGRFQGQSDVALSEEGIRQAEDLAAHFPVDSVDAVYSSDLIRARRTAEIIANRFGLRVEAKQSLREINFGDWEGLTYDEIILNWPEALSNFLQHPDILEVPNGETFPQVRKRAMDAIGDILEEQDGKSVVLTAHGGILRSILTAVLHMPLQYLWSIRQFNTAVSIVRYDEGNWTIELMNSTAHLAHYDKEKG